jgi:hypothetical protein
VTRTIGAIQAQCRRDRARRRRRTDRQAHVDHDLRRRSDDLDDEVADRDLHAGRGGDHAVVLRRGRRHKRRIAVPVAYGARRVEHDDVVRLDDDEIDVTDAVHAQPVEHRGAARPTTDDEHRSPTTAPQLGTVGHGDPRRRWASEHDRRRGEDGGAAEHGGGDREPRRWPPSNRRRRQNGHAEDREAVPCGQVAQGSARRRPRHAVDPCDQHMRGDVQHAGDDLAHVAADAHRRTGRKAGGHAPHGQRCGGGTGEQVRRDAGDGDAAEDGDEHRCHSDLGGERHCERGGDRAWSREVSLDARRQDDDGGGRACRQLEPGRSHEHRVDAEERRHRERQDADTRRLTPDSRRQRRHRGHGCGTEHRRFEAGHEREEGDGADRRGQPPPVGEPSEQRRGDGEDEGDVLP